MLTFNLHIGDWIKKTEHLSSVELDVYLKLLCKYYDTEKPIPADMAFRLALARDAERQAAVNYVLEQFFERDGDVWRQGRADEEIAKYHEKSGKAAASAKSRWDKTKPTQCESDTDAMRTHTERNADGMLTTNQEPQTINHEPLPKNQEPQAKENTVAVPAEVAAVFSHWQRVMGKNRSSLDDKRKRLIRARLKDGYTVDQLRDAITGCSRSPFHMGLNDKSQRYDSLELILRDAGKVDQFIGFLTNPPKAGQPGMTRLQKVIAVNKPDFDAMEREISGTVAGSPAGDFIEGEVINAR